MAAPKKGVVPPQFAKAGKGAAAKAVAKGAKVRGPEGKTGIVVATMGGIAKVRHADGTVDTHPKGALKKAAPTKKTGK